MLIELYNGTIVIDYKDESHRYYLKGKPIQSVSTVVGMLDKPQLSFWKLNMAKEFLDDILNKGISINQSHIQEAIQHHKAVADEAKNIGTKVHDYCEQFAKAILNGKELPQIPNNIDEKIVNGINAFLEFFSGDDIEFIEFEKTIYSQEFDYAGRFDALINFNGKLTLIDYKTSKGIYDEMDWQLAGYVVAFNEELKWLSEKVGFTPNYIKQAMLVHFDKETGLFTPHIVEDLEKKKEIFKKMVSLRNLIK